ncbi:MAG: ABC transporter permease [Negativicutes bacterium]
MVWQICKQEFYWMFRKDPRRAFYLFGSSVFYVILFGLLYSPNVVNYIPTVVYDQDQTVLSRSLVQSFDDLQRYHIVDYVTSEEEMDAAIRQKTAHAAISIPPNFARDIKKGLSSQVLVSANGSNIAIGNAIISSAQEIIAAFSAKVSQGLAENTVGLLPGPAAHYSAPVTFQLRALNNPNLGYLNFFVLGVVMAALQEGILLALGSSLLNDKHDMDHFSQGRPLILLIGKLMPYWLGGMIAFVCSTWLSVLLFDIPCQGNLLQLLLLGAAFTFAVTALGGLAALAFSDEVDFNRLVLIYAVPAFIYSGYTWPQQSMDQVSFLLSLTFPMTYVTSNLRSLMVAGYAPNLSNGIGVLFLMGAVAFCLAGLVYHRQRMCFLQEQNNTAGAE